MRESDTSSPVIWPSWCYSGRLDEASNSTNSDDNVVEMNTYLSCDFFSPMKTYLPTY